MPDRFLAIRKTGRKACVLASPQTLRLVSRVSCVGRRHSSLPFWESKEYLSEVQHSTPKPNAREEGRSSGGARVWEKWKGRSKKWPYRDISVMRADAAGWRGHYLLSENRQTDRQTDRRMVGSSFRLVGGQEGRRHKKE